VTATTLRIDGFANDIVINTTTKVEQVGAGNVDVTAIKVGQTLQVHVRLSGTTYTAQQVHIEDKYVKADADDEQVTDPTLKTWQGTIASIAPDAKFITLTEVSPPFSFRIVTASVLQDAKHKSIVFANLAVSQKVTITGRLLTDGSAEIVKLVVTTETSVNPGKGNGKN
jgi:LysM repeat protein